MRIMFQKLREYLPLLNRIARAGLVFMLQSQLDGLVAVLSNSSGANSILTFGRGPRRALGCVFPTHRPSLPLTVSLDSLEANKIVSHLSMSRTCGVVDRKFSAPSI